MSSIFQKRRSRLLEMKALRGNYLPPERALTCPKCAQDSPRKEISQNFLVCPGAGITGRWGPTTA